jgi:hypothetical protein
LRAYVSPILIDDLEPSAAYWEFLTQGAGIIESSKNDTTEGTNIKILAFSSQTPLCCAIKIDEKNFVIAVTDMFASLLAHRTSFFCLFDVVRAAFPFLQDGIVLKKRDARFFNENDLRPSEVASIYNNCRPVWTLGLSYVFSHELAHIINGHLDYIKQVKIPVGTRVRQTLEFDADCFSSSFLLRNLRRPLSPYAEWTEGDDEKIVTLLLMAVAAALSVGNADPLFGIIDVESDNNHPLPFVRFNLAAAAIFSTFETAFGPLPPESDPIADIFYLALCRNTVESEAHARQKLDEMDFLAYRTLETSYAKLLERNWNSMRDDLSKLRRRITDIAPKNDWANE